MFVRYFVELALPVDQVEAALAGAPGGWLPGIAAEANEHGERLLVRVGVGPPVAADAGERRVEVELGGAVRLPTKLALPISWRPARGGLLPALEAEIEVGALGPDDTQLAINGRYTPPAGLVGRTVDRLLLHRVAEATLKRFLDEVADQVAGRMPASPAALEDGHAGGDPHANGRLGRGVAPQASPEAARPDW